MEEEEIKAQITKYAEALLTEQDISILLFGNEHELAGKCGPGGPYYLAYEKGRLTTMAKVNSSIVEMAAGGSGKAQELALELMKKQQICQH